MISLRKLGVLTEQGGVFLRKGGVLVEQEVYLRKGGVLQLIHSPNSGIDVDVPLDVYGAGAFNGPIGVTTSTANATVTGGEAPYTYLWQLTGSSGGVWGVIAPTLSATAFRCNGLDAGDSASATFTVTVKDKRGRTVTSAQITANAENYGALNNGGPIP